MVEHLPSKCEALGSAKKKKRVIHALYIVQYNTNMFLLP
jgi:hypothetical protein